MDFSPASILLSATSSVESRLQLRTESALVTSLLGLFMSLSVLLQEEILDIIILVGIRFLLFASDVVYWFSQTVTFKSQ